MITLLGGGSSRFPGIMISLASINSRGCGGLSRITTGFGSQWSGASWRIMSGGASGGWKSGNWVIVLNN